jgi:hypothetical protein
MSDRELWDALTVLARRAGWIERGQRVVVEGDPREEQPTPAPPWRSCTNVAVLVGGYRVSCRQQRGHEGDHSEGGTQWGDAPQGLPDPDPSDNRA